MELAYNAIEAKLSQFRCGFPASRETANLLKVHEKHVSIT